MGDEETTWDTGTVLRHWFERSHSFVQNQGDERPRLT